MAIQSQAFFSLGIKHPFCSQQSIFLYSLTIVKNHRSLQIARSFEVPPMKELATPLDLLLLRPPLFFEATNHSAQSQPRQYSTTGGVMCRTLPLCPNLRSYFKSPAAPPACSATFSSSRSDIEAYTWRPLETVRLFLHFLKTNFHFTTRHFIFSRANKKKTFGVAIDP